MASAHSNGKDGETVADDSLMAYYNEWCELRSQLYQYKVKINSSTVASGSDDEDTDALRTRIGHLNEELLELSACSAIKSSLLQSVQLGQITLKALSGDEPSSTEDRLRIKSQVNTTTDLSSKILRTHQEMNELQITLTTIKTENTELFRACRELTRVHQNLVFDKQTTVSKSSKDQRLTRALQTHDQLIDKLQVLQNCFQGLILGSGINWNDDEELRTVVFEIGQNVEDVLI